MQAVTNPIDSEILEGTVVEIQDFKSEIDFASFEREMVREHQPAYAVCKIPVEDLAAIHRVESVGFRFIELQVRSELRLRERYDTQRLPYVYEPVTDPADLQPVLDIAATTFDDDRFTVDPALPPGAGRRRYSAYAEQSFAAKDELIHKLTNTQTHEIVGFNTCRQMAPDQMLLLIAGVKAEYRLTGLGKILNDFVFNDFLDRGIKRIRTHQSVRNYPILNLEIGHYKFRFLQTFVVLRKIYPT